MTSQADILEDSKYKPILDHGFVGLIDVMGNDAAIANSARVSYGAGTQQVNKDKGLIRHLYRHEHTSPFEMGELKFHIKLPIFVMRQHIRHRTANVNEYSGRYSIMSSEYYVPETQHISPQSKSNNQGREEDGFDIDTKRLVQESITNISEGAYGEYLRLIGESNSTEELEDKGGLARELARMVLPVNYYTECYWKIDLHNLLRYLRLRMDHHAQYEIRVVANAMYELIKPHFPITLEAFEDYTLNGAHMSHQELEIIRKFVYVMDLSKEDARDMAGEFITNKRELDEFIAKIYRN